MLIYIDGAFINTDAFDMIYIRNEPLISKESYKIRFCKLGKDPVEAVFYVNERFINQLKNKAEIVYEKEKT